MALMQRWSVPALRASLALVYLWFGYLKLVRRSPVSGLIEDAYPMMPYPAFHYVLGAWEVAIGAGLAAPLLPISKKASDALTRMTLGTFWLQLAGAMAPAILARERVFNGRPDLLTITGEFLAKNAVLAAAGLVIGSTVNRNQFRNR
ncbi:MAG TPA: hypothetical protein VFO84_06600 [Dehalococcoidia bacterium]|nr:hypothetical protein [Dehalococcoidia bacterium]